MRSSFFFSFIVDVKTIKTQSVTSKVISKKFNVNNFISMFYSSLFMVREKLENYENFEMYPSVGESG